MENPFQLTSEQNKQYFEEIIVGNSTLDTTATKNPKFILIGGQSGAGKSSITANLNAQTNNASVVLDADELRAYHPKLAEMEKKDNTKVFEWARNDVNSWLQQLGGWAAENKRNVIMDGTLRDKENVAKAAQFYKSKDYNIELHIVATHERFSHAGIHVREQMTGRHVDPDFHKKAYDAIPETVKHLEENKLIDKVVIYGRDGKGIYENNLGNGEWEKKPTGVDALQAERNRLPLQAELESLEGQQKFVLMEMQKKQVSKDIFERTKEQFQTYKKEVVDKQKAQAFIHDKAEDVVKKHPELKGAYNVQGFLHEYINKSLGSISEVSKQLKSFVDYALQKKISQDETKDFKLSKKEVGLIQQKVQGQQLAKKQQDRSVVAPQKAKSRER